MTGHRLNSILPATLRILLVAAIVATVMCVGALQAQPPAAAQKAEKDEPAPGGAPENYLIVDSLIESNPKTPRELFRVISLLVDLREPLHALPFVTKFLDAKPADAVLAQVVREFGTAAVIRVAREKALGEDGRKMTELILAGAKRNAHDPVRLVELVKKLAAASPQTRRAALVDLSDAREDSVGAILSALADPVRRAEHTALRDALVALGTVSVEPLLGTLQTTDPALKTQVIEALGRLRVRRATFHLIAPFVATDSDPAQRQAARGALLRIIGKLPDANEARRLLQREVRAGLDGKGRLRTQADGMVKLWHWDTAKRRGAMARHHHDDALAIIAGRLGRDLFRIAPDQGRNRRLYLTSILAAAKLTGGLDHPLPTGKTSAAAEAAKHGAASIDDVLAHALTNDHIPAAIAAAQILGELGDERLLHIGEGKAAPLALAARNPDRRLRFEAAAAIVRLNPRIEFIGSSHVAEALAFAASGHGVTRALVADARPSAAATLAGMLAESDIEADSATSGRRMLKMAIDQADYEFLIVNMDIEGPPVAILLQQLRRDRRTADLPIAVTASSELLDRARRLAAADPLALAFPQPQNTRTMGYLLERLTRLGSRKHVPAAIRLSRAQAALKMIAGLTRGKRSFYDFRRHEQALLGALDVPRLSAMAAPAVANLGTHASQQTLLRIASQAVRPIATRRAAAAGFEASVKRFGIRLTSTDLSQQYERYNQSEKLDRPTQQLLGQILDVIEEPTRKKKPVAAVRE